MVAENNLDLSALNSLPEKEREYALKVLNILQNIRPHQGSEHLYMPLRMVWHTPQRQGLFEVHLPMPVLDDRTVSLCPAHG